MCALEEMCVLETLPLVQSGFPCPLWPSVPVTPGLPRSRGEPFVRVPASLAAPVGVQLRTALAGAAATLAGRLLLLPPGEAESGEQADEGKGGTEGEGVEGDREEREGGRGREEEAGEREWERESDLQAAVRAQLNLKVPSEVLARLLTSQFDMPWELPMSLAQYEEVGRLLGPPPPPSGAPFSLPPAVAPSTLWQALGASQGKLRKLPKSGLGNFPRAGTHALVLVLQVLPRCPTSPQLGWLLP